MSSYDEGITIDDMARPRDTARGMVSFERRTGEGEWRSTDEEELLTDLDP